MDWKPATHVVIARPVREQTSRVDRNFRTCVLSLLTALAIVVYFGSGRNQASILGEKVPVARAVIIEQTPHVKASSMVSIGKGETKLVHTPAKLKKDSPATLAKMEKEVISLEEQIQKHMAAREKALVKVVAAAPNCTTQDVDCYQSHDQVKWKASQDKYEKAALTDILKDKENSSTEGAALFKSYASSADKISGLHSLAALNSETSKLVHLHAVAEHASLHALRQAESKLHALKMDEQKERDDEQAAQEKAAITQMQEHMKEELAKMSGHGPAVNLSKTTNAEAKVATCEGDCDSTSFVPEQQRFVTKSPESENVNTVVKVLSKATNKATNKPLPSEQSYQRDFAQAKEVEAFRRKAFLEVEKTLESQVLADRKARTDKIDIEHARDEKLQSNRRSEDARTKSPSASDSSDVSEAYSSDFQQALKIEQERQAAQSDMIKHEREKSAVEEQIAHTLFTEHNAALKSSKTGTTASVALGATKKDDTTKSVPIMDEDKSLKLAEEVSGDTKYRKDIQDALRISKERELKHMAAILNARAHESKEDSKAEARAMAEVKAQMLRAGSLASNVLPADYTAVSSLGYEKTVAAAKVRSLARTALEDAVRKKFYASRLKTLAEDSVGGQVLFKNRANEVMSILGTDQGHK